MVNWFRYISKQSTKHDIIQVFIQVNLFYKFARLLMCLEMLLKIKKQIFIFRSTQFHLVTEVNFWKCWRLELVTFCWQELLTNSNEQWMSHFLGLRRFLPHQYIEIQMLLTSECYCYFQEDVIGPETNYNYSCITYTVQNKNKQP